MLFIHVISVTVSRAEVTALISYVPVSLCKDVTSSQNQDNWVKTNSLQLVCESAMKTNKSVGLEEIHTFSSNQSCFPSEASMFEHYNSLKDRLYPRLNSMNQKWLYWHIKMKRAFYKVSVPVVLAVGSGAYSLTVTLGNIHCIQRLIFPLVPPMLLIFCSNVTVSANGLSSAAGTESPCRAEIESGHTVTAREMIWHKPKFSLLFWKLSRLNT